MCESQIIPKALLSFFFKSEIRKRLHTGAARLATSKEAAQAVDGCVGFLGLPLQSTSDLNNRSVLSHNFRG